MRRLIALFAVAAFAATLLPTTADAAGKRQRVVRAYEQPVAYEQVYAAEPVYVDRRRPVYAQAAVVPPHPLLFPIGGAIIGAVIGAAVCPPCAIAGSALTSTSGALVGAGIGAVGGTVVGVAAYPAYYRY